MLLSKKITFLSILTVLSLLFQLVACFIPTNTVFFTLFSTVFVMIGIFEYKIKSGILIYVVTSILGFFLVPEKNIWFLFVIFFGYYPILKAIIERLKKLYSEWILKILSGSLIFFIAFKIYNNLFLTQDIKLPFIFIFLISLIIFIIYDIALSIFLNFYIKKIRNHIKRS